MGPDLSKLAYNQSESLTRGSLHHWFLFLRHSPFCPFDGKARGYTRLMDQGEERFFLKKAKTAELKTKKKTWWREKRSHISSFCLKVTTEHSHHMSALNEVVQLSISSHLSFFLYLFSSSRRIVPTFQGSSFLSPSPPWPPKQRPPTWWYISTLALMKRVSLAHR